jgi:hypothetical protein
VEEHGKANKETTVKEGNYIRVYRGFPICIM